MRRLAIIVTHSIQYYAPVFKALSSSKEVSLKVFYTWGEGSLKKYDPGFKREVEWDIPVLEGYDYVFLENTSRKPGSSRFRGIINPDAVEAISAFDPHAVLVYGWSWQSHLNIIRSFHKKRPVWFRGDSNLLDGAGGWKKTMRTLFLRWMYRHVDKAFYVGTANRQYFHKFGLKDAQLKFAPHAIDNDRFSISRVKEADALRQQLGIPEDGVLALFAGKLEPKKDPIALLEAFCSISLPNAYLLFAGNGVLEAELKRKAAASPRYKNIRFLEFQNQASMPVLYQSCQLFCLPSKGPGETWGLAVNEAMAAGRAVLVSDKSGCAADLVREGVNGSVVRAGDQAGLAQKLQGLLADPLRLHAMGRKSAEMIRAWSFDRQAEAILEEVRNLQTV